MNKDTERQKKNSNVDSFKKRKRVFCELEKERQINI